MGGVGGWVKNAKSHEKMQLDVAKRPSNGVKKLPNESDSDAFSSNTSAFDPKSGQKRPYDRGEFDAIKSGLRR